MQLGRLWNFIFRAHLNQSMTWLVVVSDLTWVIPKTSPHSLLKVFFLVSAIVQASLTDDMPLLLFSSPSGSIAWDQDDGAESFSAYEKNLRCHDDSQGAPGGAP